VYRDRLIDAEASRQPRAALAERGHQWNIINDWSWIVGGGQGIARDPESGALMAGADPRRDGYALRFNPEGFCSPPQQQDCAEAAHSGNTYSVPGVARARCAVYAPDAPVVSTRGALAV
jgi:hypothetical protein